MTGLIAAPFAGGGGASEGIRLALGRCPDVVRANTTALAGAA